jgi:hypothetical protein
MIVAKTMQTSYSLNQAPNTSINMSQRCSDGKLVIKGVLVSNESSTMQNLRLSRRSTLNDWFK